MSSEHRSSARGSPHPLGTDGALAPSLVSATTWRSASFEDAADAARTPRPTAFYARFGNPSVRALERAIAKLEHAEDAIAFGSGMGGLTTTVLALCSSGSHIVATQQLFSGTLAFLQGPCKRFGIDVTIVDGTRPADLAAAVRPATTALVIAETPSNPLLELADLSALGAIRGPFTMVDSTLATPIGQRPLDSGVDLVLHAATKGIGGHNDASLGVVAGERDLIDSLWAYSLMHGAVASPFDATNALRGLKTLAVRQRQQSSNAHAVARWLSERDDVVAVHYPGLEHHPQHQLAVAQMADFGTMVSFELPGGVESARRVLNRLRLIGIATSFGGPESLACHPATTTAASVDREQRERLGISEGLIRLSLGLESATDLIADLAGALTP